MPLLDPRITAPKPSRSKPAISCSPVPGSRSALAKPCHLPSGKKPVELITSARTASGCSHAQRIPMRPPQSWTTSTHVSMPSSERKRSTDSMWRSQVPGGSGSESPYPAKSGATARQPASATAGITSFHMNDDSGKPCSSRTTGASAGPALAV